MTEREAIEMLYVLATNNKTGKYKGSYEEAFDILINKIETQQEKLEKKDKLYHRALSDLVIADEIINEMAEYLSTITDCPCENKGANLDCENRCTSNIESECWKMYFKNMVATQMSGLYEED